MARCDVCGGDYDQVMNIRLNGRSGTYDCFECAIHAMAPACQHCGCKVIGHGVEIFCCVHCAKVVGANPIYA